MEFLRSAPGAADPEKGLDRLVSSEMTNNNLRLAPKAVTPISTKSRSVRDGNVVRSISCVTKTFMYFSSPKEVKRVAKSGHLHPVILFRVLVGVWSIKLLAFKLTALEPALYPNGAPILLVGVFQISLSTFSLGFSFPSPPGLVWLIP